MLNSLDPDQDRHSVSPNIGPNCLQSLSANDKSRQSLKELIVCKMRFFSAKNINPSYKMVLE